LSAPPVVNPTGESLPPPIHNPQPKVPPVVKPPDNQPSQPNAHIGREVSFHTDEVPPSQYLYLQSNDQLVIVPFTNNPNLSLVFQYRFLTPHGEIKEGQTTQLLGGNPITPQYIPLGECWLLSFGLQLSGNSSRGEWAWVSIGVRRFNESINPNSSHAAIWEGFVYYSASRGWPGSPQKEPTDGAGTLRMITGTQPAVGAEILEQVPQNLVWRLVYFSATLASSATAINRTARFRLQDGLSILGQFGVNTTQAASLTYRYTLAPGATSGYDGSDGIQISGSSPMELKTGQIITTKTVNLQAGDQWSAPIYVVREWPDVDNL
jgi:hypothetical protein